MDQKSEEKNIKELVKLWHLQLLKSLNIKSSTDADKLVVYNELMRRGARRKDAKEIVEKLNWEEFLKELNR